MNILIDKRKKLYLTRDQYQWIIRKDTGNVDEKDRPIYSNMDYIGGGLERVAEKLYQHKINESTAQTISELKNDHNKAIKEIRELFLLEGLLK